MTTEQLRTVMEAQPFRPFTLHMADGRTFPVTHPEFLSHSPSWRTVIIYREDESFSILDLLLMTEVRVDSSTTARP